MRLSFEWRHSRDDGGIVVVAEIDVVVEVAVVDIAVVDKRSNGLRLEIH